MHHHGHNIQIPLLTQVLRDDQSQHTKPVPPACKQCQNSSEHQFWPSIRCFEEAILDAEVNVTPMVMFLDLGADSQI